MSQFLNKTAYLKPCLNGTNAGAANVIGVTSCEGGRVNIFDTLLQTVNIRQKSSLETTGISSLVKVILNRGLNKIFHFKQRFK